MCSGWRSVPVPVPGPREVLVQVVATSLNLSDWEGLVGSPAYARFGGLRRPRRHVLGSDIAGIVAAVGSGVTRFAVGDEVYGDNLQRLGGFAEFAIAPEAVLALKPAALTFAQASTIPQAGAIALHGTAGRETRRAGADQRRRRRLRSLRHPAGEGGRRARDGGRQRRQARVHALARRRCGDRLSRRGLHGRRTVRPDPRPRRVPLGVRLSPGYRSGRALSRGRRQRQDDPPDPDARHGDRTTLGSADGDPRRAHRTGALSRWSPTGARRARSTSMWTAPSRCTRPPTRSPTSAKDARSARWSSSRSEPDCAPGQPATVEQDRRSIDLAA